jgi:ribonucleoside-diphosphate reductase alpha chain
MFHEKQEAPPTRLRGSTMVVTTPLGKSFVTVNENGGHQPFEAFITTAQGRQ